MAYPGHYNKCPDSQVEPGHLHLAFSAYYATMLGPVVSCGRKLYVDADFCSLFSFNLMKKSLFLLPFLLIAGAAHAQTNALKVDIFQPIINTLALSFEHKLSESSSFQLGLAGTFGYKDDSDFFYGIGNNSTSRSTSGIAITPEYRLYLSEKHPALEGFYVAPYARFQYLNQNISSSLYNPNGGNPTTGSYDASLTALGLGVTVGRHWIFKQRFSLDIFLGPGYTFSSVSSDQPGYTARKGDFVGYANNNSYDFRGGVTFGIAF